MFDVIEHLFDPRAVLEATRRALTPGGVLVVSTPNFDALSRYALGLDWAVLSPLEHVYYFTEATLAKMLASTGYGDVTPMRDALGRGPVETMNFHYSHAPGTIRNRLYRAAVTYIGPGTYGLVQSSGHGDALVCVGRVR